jgi:hypothetical protein
VVALAACTPEGLTAADAEQWVARYCAAARPVPGAPGQAQRWTTDLAGATEARLWACARTLAVRPPQTRDGWPPAGAAPAGPGLAPQALVAARELVTGGRSLHILQAPAGRTNLLAQAAALEAAGTVWRVQGQRVEIETGSDQAAQRWRVLTGLDRHRWGSGADVVVVDHADRRPAAELLALLRQLDRSGARTVLVEGGTAPRLSWRCSTALAELGDRWGRLDPGPPPAWGADLESPISGRSGWTAAEAVRTLLGTWVEARAGPQAALLVGLGFAEVDGLNQAARAILVERGLLAGPVLVSSGRRFQAGDQALALRRLAPGLPPGTSISVAEVDPRRGAVAVTAPDHRTHVLDRAAMAHVGHGYAVTPSLAVRASNPLLVLGFADALGPARSRVVTAALARAETGRSRDQAISLDMVTMGMA